MDRRKRGCLGQMRDILGGDIDAGAAEGEVPMLRFHALEGQGGNVGSHRPAAAGA